MKRFENLFKFGHKRNLFECVAKEGAVVKRISDITNKPGTLPLDNRKDTLTAFQE